MMLKGLKTRRRLKIISKSLEIFNGKNSKSFDRINYIFILFKISGTIVEQMVKIILENLIKYEIPIITNLL